MDVTALLNESFACKRCGTVGTWVRIARPAARLNSIVHRLRCARCGERVVAKQDRHVESSTAGVAQLRREYDTLRLLETTFPQDGSYGTLTPLGYLEKAGSSVMITRLFASADLARYVRPLNDAGLEKTFRSAGTWLRKLHYSDGHARRMQSLGVADKLGCIDRETVAILRKNSGMRKTRDLLAQVGSDIEELPVPAARLHGDFKPENLLFDGTRCMGLDIHWQIVGAAVYDLAPFLDHLWLEGGVMSSACTIRRYNVAETAFLAGYEYAGGTKLLRWTQLYFVLHYMAKRRRWGALGTAYVNRKLERLASRLACQLRDGI